MIPLFLSHEQWLKYHGLFLSHLRQHRWSTLPWLVQFVLWCHFGIRSKWNLAQTKMKALPDSSLYGPYQALSSSNPLLQASFTGIAIRRGINGECNFFKIIFWGNSLYCNCWWFESHIFGINLLFGVLIVVWLGFVIVTQLGVGFVILWSNSLVSHYIKHGLRYVFLLHIKFLFNCFLGHNLPNPCPTFWDKAKSLFCSAIRIFFFFWEKYLLFCSESIIDLVVSIYWNSQVNLCSLSALSGMYFLMEMRLLYSNCTSSLWKGGNA